MSGSLPDPSRRTSWRRWRRFWLRSIAQLEEARRLARAVREALGALGKGAGRSEELQLDQALVALQRRVIDTQTVHDRVASLDAASAQMREAVYALPQDVQNAESFLATLAVAIESAELEAARARYAGLPGQRARRRAARAPLRGATRLPVAMASGLRSVIAGFS